jgi:hypothetical protein
MTRRLLTAVAYMAVTLVVLASGAALLSLPRFEDGGRAVVIYLGAALLLLGAGRLVLSAVRSMNRSR